MPVAVLRLIRSPLAIGAAAGLALGLALWVLLGARTPAQAELGAVQGRLAAQSQPRTPSAPPASLVNTAIAHPLFALTTGPGAVPEPVVRLFGIARTPAHQAALISVDEGQAQWVELGQSLGSVTVVGVLQAKVVLETPFGRREADLGDPAPPSGQAPAGAMPPPPASAPGAP